MNRFLASTAAVFGLTLASGAATAAERYIGGGAQTGVSAPLVFLGAGGPKVSVTQLLYSQPELGIPTGGRIIDVAWRKADLEQLPTAGCNVELWMKNVTLNTVFAADSTQTFGDATNTATKVFSGNGIGLPSAMGFVGLTQAIDAIAFDYQGGDLEVTIVAACDALAGDVSASPLLFRYDDLPQRARYALLDAAPTAATVLTAEPWFVSRRPHTRFRFLNPTKTIALRVGDFSLTAGASYATAAKHLSMGKSAPFRFIAVNDSIQAVTATAVNLTNNLNGTPMQSTPALAGLAPGSETPLQIDITPTAAALTRYTMTIATDAANAPNFAVTFQGTATATPEAQPNLAELKPDKTTTNIAQTGGSVQLGNVPVGSEREVNLVASNFGAADAVPVAATVTQQPAGGSATAPANPTALNTQVDEKVTTQVRAPTTPGPFLAHEQVIVGTSIWEVDLTGTAVAPELDVDSSTGPILTPYTEQLGSVTLGEPISRTFTLKNTGTGELVFKRVTFTKSDVPAVLLSRLPVTLAPGASAPLKIDFVASGPNPDVLVTVASNDSDENPFLIRLTKSGGPGLLVSFGADELLRGEKATGASLLIPNDMVTLTYQNLGDTDLTLTAIAIQGVTNCSPTREAGTPITIPAGGSVDDVIHVKPTVWGQSNGLPFEMAVTISSNDPAGDYSVGVEGLARKKNGCSATAFFPSTLLLEALRRLGARRRRRAKALRTLHR